MTALAEDVDDRFAGIDIDSLLNRAERRPFTYGRKKTLYEAPEFIQRLQGEETVLEGQSLCIDCKVTGFPVPTLRWFKDDEEIIDHPRINVEGNGMGGYSLMIACVNKGDEAAYRCRAENLEGATSSCFFLSVKAKPKSQKKKDSKNAPNRRTVSFPPMFATIVEKVEEEEKQGKELQTLAPSPLTDFYYALTLKSRQSWPSFVGDWAFVNGRPDRRRTCADDDQDEEDEMDNEERERHAASTIHNNASTGAPKPQIVPKIITVSAPNNLPESGERAKTQLQRRRRERQESNREATPDVTDRVNAGSAKEKDIGNKEGRASDAGAKVPTMASGKSEDIRRDGPSEPSSKYQKMKEELLQMEKDLERKLQAKMKRDEEERKKLEEKRKQDTMAKIEADKARLKEDEKRRLELRKQLEEDLKKQAEEEKKAADKLKAQQNGSISVGKKDDVKSDVPRKNGPAALAMFQNKLHKPEEVIKKSGEATAQNNANAQSGQSRVQPSKSNAPLTPMEAMRQREKSQIDSLKQREKQQIDDLRKREQKQLDELRAKRQPEKIERTDQCPASKETKEVKQAAKPRAEEEKRRAEEEKRKAEEKEREEKAKVKSQINALRGKELKLREDLGAKEAQQREELRMKDVRLREDMKKSHEKEDEEQRRKEAEKKRGKEKEEEQNRIEKKKELLRKEQLRRQHEEETRHRQERAHESEAKQGILKGKAVEVDDEIKVHKRDYSFEDLRKSLESQLGGHVMNEEEHRYWDEILKKHNYSIADVKKAFESGTEKPARIRSRRNSVEEAELLKLKRSGSITDLKESYTRSLGRPKKKPVDGEKRQKDEMFLKRATSISDLRHQFLEVAHKPPSGAKLLGVPGKQEAEITIRNRKTPDTLRPSEIRQRSKSPTPVPFLNSSASSPSLLQVPESRQLAAKHHELSKLTGTVAAKRASFHEKLAELAQKDDEVAPQKKHFGRDAYGSRDIPVYKRAHGWSDDIGKPTQPETPPNIEKAKADKNTPSAATKEVQPSSTASVNPRKNYVSSSDITDRPFLYNSTRTTARKFSKPH